VDAVMRDPYSARGAMMHFPRVRLAREADGSVSARLTGAQGSGVATSMAAADGLAILPADTPVSPSDRMRVAILGGAPLVEEPPF